MKNIDDPLFAEVATTENAIAYMADPEKFVFCVVLLEISANDDNCDDLVEALENRYDELYLEHITSE